MNKLNKRIIIVVQTLSDKDLHDLEDFIRNRRYEGVMLMNPPNMSKIENYIINLNSEENDE